MLKQKNTHNGSRNGKIYYKYIRHIVVVVIICNWFFYFTSIEVGKNKGKIELVQQQQMNDIKRIEERTRLELHTLTTNVGVLSDNVNELVIALAKKNLK